VSSDFGFYYLQTPSVNLFGEKPMHEETRKLIDQLEIEFQKSLREAKTADSEETRNVAASRAIELGNRILNLLEVERLKFAKTQTSKAN
jgi:ribulose 1,5-bisphosphate synthetase/thiazole synthase